MNVLQLRQIRCPAAEFGQLSSWLLNQGYAVRFRAQGTSMHPVIQDGDIVRVEPVVRDKIRVGDVVFYLTSTGKPVVHRVIGRTWGPSLVLKGDSACRVDALLPATRVRGRVAAVERGSEGVALRMGRGRYRTVLRSWVTWLTGPALVRLRRHRWDPGQPVLTYYTDEENVDND